MINSYNRSLSPELQLKISIFAISGIICEYNLKLRQ